MLRAEAFMKEALREAARDENEVPVGAVVVYDGKIIARAHNERESAHPFAHAEMLAMERACRILGNRRLHGCTLYVTLEPCPMCAGAIINARVPVVVYGAREALSGSCGSVVDLFFERYGHRPAVYAGVMAEECAALLRAFFREKRGLY